MQMILEKYPDLGEITGKQVTSEHGKTGQPLPQRTLSSQEHRIYECEPGPAESGFS